LGSRGRTVKNGKAHLAQTKGTRDPSRAEVKIRKPAHGKLSRGKKLTGESGGKLGRGTTKTFSSQKKSL